jgi:large subunit ribosomal protein L19
MDQILAKIFKRDMSRELNFDIGDTVKVHYKILESGKERIQVYEGVVISENNKMNDRSFTVRRISYDIGVERIFPLYSPRIAKVELVRKGDVRRAKLYYLRERSGKTARIKELRGGQAIVQAERKKQAAATVAAEATKEQVQSSAA